MKTTTIILVAVLGGGTINAEPIPPRSPEMGESRPTWWLSCWKDHVVVIEGTISVEEDNIPDVTVHVDKDTAKTFFDEDDIKLQKTFSSFYLARLKPKRLIFASPAITSTDGNIAGINTGATKELTFLIPLLDSDGRFMTIMGGRDKQEGVFVLRYGSLVVGVPLVFDETIPEDGLESANKVFEHRNRLDHRNHKYNKKQNKSEMATPRKPSD